MHLIQGGAKCFNSVKRKKTYSNFPYSQKYIIIFEDETSKTLACGDVKASFIVRPRQILSLTKSSGRSGGWVTTEINIKKGGTNKTG